jgi:hypothetical protein
MGVSFGASFGNTIATEGVNFKGLKNWAEELG